MHNLALSATTPHYDIFKLIYLNSTLLILQVTVSSLINCITVVET